MMLQRCTLRTFHLLVLVMCVSASEDFDWTKNERTSFYYGTFPTGRTSSIRVRISKSKGRLTALVLCSAVPS